MWQKQPQFFLDTTYVYTNWGSISFNKLPVSDKFVRNLMNDASFEALIIEKKAYIERLRNEKCKLENELEGILSMITTDLKMKESFPEAYEIFLTLGYENKSTALIVPTSNILSKLKELES